MAQAVIRARVHNRRTLNHLSRIIREIEDVTPDLVEEMRDQTKLDTVRLLRKRQHPRGTPTPSVAPEPPARVDGHLGRAFVSPPAVETMPGTWSATLGNTAVYSRIQELGGVSGRGHRSRLPPRPYLSRAVEELAAIDFYKGVAITYWGAAVRAG